MNKFATAVNCMDGRVQRPVLDYFREKLQLSYVDMITLPGPSKVLSEGKEEEMLKMVLRGVKLSVERHGSRKVALCGHFDCAGNPAKKSVQIEQIERGLRTLKEWVPEVEVVGLWVNEAWEVEALEGE